MITFLGFGWLMEYRIKKILFSLLLYFHFFLCRVSNGNNLAMLTLRRKSVYSLLSPYPPMGLLYFLLLVVNGVLVSFFFLLCIMVVGYGRFVSCLLWAMFLFPLLNVWCVNKKKCLVCPLLIFEWSFLLFFHTISVCFFELLTLLTVMALMAMVSAHTHSPTRPVPPPKT